MNRANFTFLIFISGLLLCMSCSSAKSGGGPNQPLADGDPEDDSWETEEELDLCRNVNCASWQYCDPIDGLCKTKTCDADRDCGVFNPLTGITPICRDGKCEEVFCNEIINFDMPPYGVDLPSSGYPKTTLIEDRKIIFDNKQIFIIGAQGIHPDLFEDARLSGFNLAVTNVNCCQTQEDLDYQIEEFLDEAQKNDIFGAVRAIWPPEQIEGDLQTIVQLQENIRDRYNMVALLFWIGSDRADAIYEDTIPSLYEFVMETNDSKPFAIGGDKGYDPTDPSQADPQNADPSQPDDVLFIATLDADASIDPAPGDEIQRVRRSVADSQTVFQNPLPVLARIPVADHSSERLVTVSLHSLASGADGVIFEFGPEDSASPQNWEAAQSAARFLHTYSNLWMNPVDPTTIRLNADTTEVKLFSVRHHYKHTVAFLVNASNTAKTVTLQFITESLPYCRADTDTETYLTIERETELEVVLEPGEYKQFQVSEAGAPGER